MKGIQYSSAYIVPVLCCIGILQGGIMVWSAVLFAFVLVPILEPFLQKDAFEYSKDQKKSRLGNVFFDALLYLNIPVVFILLFTFLYRADNGLYTMGELIGLVASIGVTLGACGINVAHELGHRDSKWEQFLSKTLLLPSQYMHFFIEHNRGHHKFIATEQDAATAKYKESLYVFWVRSIIGQYTNAWKLENKRLERAEKRIIGIQNEMIIFTFFQLIFIVSISLIFSSFVLMLYLSIALISVLLLETINYVEHYGLRRKKQPNGRYEQVQVWHSWNSNHKLGRIILYELTRHSDHHFQSNKKYQILEHKDKAPQLPVGYPSSMLLALIPPLWFKVMNKRVEKISTEIV
jgi:alkane 1-monooxygenase